jgi:lysophospholipase L1-like esterase
MAPIPWSRQVYRLNPNLNSTLYFADPKAGSFKAQTNNWGFRDRDFILSENAFPRVMVLGDSYTFGYANKVQDAFPQATETILRQKLEIPARIMNLGIPGYDTIQEEALLEVLGPQLNPDIVVLSYVMNDAEPPWEAITDPRILYQYAFSWIWEDLALGINKVIFAHQKWHTRKLLTSHPYIKSFEPHNVNWRSSKEAIGKMADFCAIRKIRFLAVILPDPNEPFNEHYPDLVIHEAVQSWAKEFQFDVLDLWDIFKGRDNSKLRVWGDGHPNARYHALVAEALSEKVHAVIPSLRRQLLSSNQ